MSSSRESSSGARLAGSTTMLLIAAGRATARQLEARLAEHDLTLRHVGALGHVARTPGLTVSDLARRAHVTPQSMHATVAQLAERGAVVVEARGRAVYPELTETGRQLLATAAQIAAEIDRALKKQLDDPASFRQKLEQIVRAGLAINP